MSAEEKAEIILPAPIGARFAALLIDWILVNIVAQPLILGAEIFNNVSAATSGVSGSTEVFDLAFPLLINFAIGAVYYGYF
jgi:hypothetical protein